MINFKFLVPLKYTWNG